VDWISLTNRTWWYDSVMLSNYALNELQVRWVAQGGLASDQQVASIYVEHRHGLARPVIAITNPTSASAYTISNSTGAVYLAGTWSDDSSVTGISWFSENLGSMGPATVYYGPSGTDGWWVANNVPLEELAFNTVDMTALDDDGDTRSAAINLTNGDGALPCDFTKVKYVINRKKPGKDKLKFKAELGPGVDTGFAFDQNTQFTLRIADTNGVYTNIFFEATPTKFNAKKGIYQLANPKLGKVLCKLKSSFGIVTLQVKCSLKKLTGLEQIINVPDADIPKKTPVDYEMPVNIRLTPHFSNKKAETKYFGKLGKKTVGSL
jgi:hypothetical protein